MSTCVQRLKNYGYTHTINVRKSFLIKVEMIGTKEKMKVGVINKVEKMKVGVIKKAEKMSMAVNLICP